MRTSGWIGLLSLALVGCSGPSGGPGAPDVADGADGVEAGDASPPDAGPDATAEDAVAEVVAVEEPYCGPPAPPLLDPSAQLEIPHGVPEPGFFESSLCQQFCHWNAHCGDPLSTGDCTLDCKILLETGRATNVACYVSGCQPDVCLTEDPLPTPDACGTLCASASDCPAVLLLGLPDAPAPCETMCAGKATASPSFAAALDCMAPAMQACDAETALACLEDGAMFCPHVCEEVGGCGGAPFETVYETPADCYEDCNVRSPELAMITSLCFLHAECLTDASCLEPTIEPGCDAWAEAMVAACGEYAWPPTVGTAAAACTVLARLHGRPLHPDPAACFEQYPRCPSTSLVQLSCAFEAPPECDPLCDQYCACELLSREACEAFCNDQYLDTGYWAVEHAVECVEPAACDLEVLSECFSTDPTTIWSCAAYCDEVSTCGDPPVDYASCVSGCELGTKNGEAAWFAEMYCLHTAGGGCEAATECQTVELPLKSVSCAASCAEHNPVCHHWPIGFDNGQAACEAACAQILEANGAAGDEVKAACVAAHLDHDCLPDGLEACFER